LNVSRMAFWYRRYADKFLLGALGSRFSLLVFMVAFLVVDVVIAGVFVFVFAFAFP
jgi:hypothetical protein